jgi:protein O-mannosyl-transferase
MARKRQKNQNPKVAGSIQQTSTGTPLGLSFQSSTLVGLSVILTAVAIFLYFPISGHPFVNFDDRPYIFENPHIQNGINLEAIRWALTTVYEANWHPLTWVAHAVDIAMYGQNAGGHHVTSMLFHTANSVLLFLLLAVVTRSVGKSLLVGAIFAVHPLNVESVAWAAELKNVLCTFFFLLSLGAYGWYARKPGFFRYLAVAVLFALGLCSKPMVVTLPCVLLLIDFWPLRRVKGLAQPSPTFLVPQWSVFALLLEKIPLLALSAASSWVTLYAQRAQGATEVVHASLGTHLSNAVVSYATYFLETFVPLGLAVFIPFPLHGIPLWKIISSIALLLIATGFAVRWARRKPYLLAGWLFFLGTLVPVLGIIQVGGQARADRYTYIPIIGLLCSTVWGVSEIVDAKSVTPRWRVIASATVLIFFYALSARQISFWDSSYDMWTRSIAIEDSSTAERNLSVAILVRSGATNESFQHALRAVELDPDDYASHVNLGNSYHSRGDEQQALNQYKIVMEKCTNRQFLLAASLYAGSSYVLLGDLAKAQQSYRSALRIAPDNSAALQALASIGKARAGAPAASAN